MALRMALSHLETCTRLEILCKKVFELKVLEKCDLAQKTYFYSLKRIFVAVMTFL